MFMTVTVIKPSMRWEGQMRSTYKIVGKSRGKIPFGRPRSNWEVNIKIYVFK